MGDRKMMDAALKSTVVAELRNHGFQGAFPHYRRFNENNIDLITFQFNRWGGSFVVELAVCPKEGTTMDWGKRILPNNVTAQDINTRFRLGANSQGKDGIWFNFKRANSEEDYIKVSKKVLKRLKAEDANWISSLFEK